MITQPAKLEPGPRRSGRIAGLGEPGLRAQRSFEGLDVRRCSLVIPERRGLSCQRTVFVDENGAVHLAARADRLYARTGLRNGGEQIPNGRDSAIPPLSGLLLRPTKLRHDLIMLAGGDPQNLPGPVDKRRPCAAGADIDGKRQASRHRFSSCFVGSTSGNGRRQQEVSPLEKA